MEKSPDAFRTISEVAELLETPAHVLRFWESRFPQIRPVKRAGGRRYYRPADVGLLTGIKRLLHDEGMTIRGVQKILREQGVKYVSGMADDSSAEDDDAALEAALALSSGGVDDSPQLPAAEAETAQIIALQSALNEAPVVDRPEDHSEQAVPGDVEEEPFEGDASPQFAPDHAPPSSPLPTPFVPRAKAPLAEPPPRKPPADDGIPDLFDRMVTAATVTEDEDEPVEIIDFGASPKVVALAASGSEDTDHVDAQSDDVDEDPETEAPMAVWAETEEPDTALQKEDDPPPAAPPMLKITRIGAAAVPAPSAPPLPETADHAVPEVVSSGIAARLRATKVDDLTVSDRATLALIRARARSLKDRLAAPPRSGA